MSLAEIKTAVETLTDEEREELASTLHVKALVRDPEWLAEMDRRIDSYLQGNFVTAEEMHRILEAHPATE